MNITKYSIKVCLVFIIGVLIGSCQNNHVSQKEQDFTNLYSSVVMNQQIRLQLPEEIIGELGEHTILLMVHNESSEYIHLPSDFNVHLISYIEGKGWSEVDNFVNYLDDDGVIITPNGTLGDVTAINVLPFQGPENFRVVIVGNIVREDKITEEQVGAFLDIDLNK